MLPIQAIAAAVMLDYWADNNLNALFVTLFLIVVFAINMLSVHDYGEVEFLLSMTKIMVLVGFMCVLAGYGYVFLKKKSLSPLSDCLLCLTVFSPPHRLLAIVINIGGVSEGYIGLKYWHDPGAFHNGFKGICTVFATASFAFAGTELVGLAAAETERPRKSFPKAIKAVFWRVTLFNIISLFLIGLIVPYTEKGLLSSTTKMDPRTSPFVIAIERAAIAILPSIMNAFILIAIIAVGSMAVFGSSRTLTALADQAQAPACFSYIDRKGRPLVAILTAFFVGLVAYVATQPEKASVLDWLGALCGLSSTFTWGSICLCHIRFRHTWAARHHNSHDDIPWSSHLDVTGSWIGLIVNIVVILAQFWVAAFPVGTSAWPLTDDASTLSPKGRAVNFFFKFACVPVVIVFYVLHKLWWRTSFVRTADMDIDTGRHGFDVPLILAVDIEDWNTTPWWKHIYEFLC